MTLGKDASIAADSTISSSPAGATDASPQIKRAARTYGKRPEEPLAEGTADPAWYTTSSSANIHKTAPPGLKETIPPSSPDKMSVEPDVFDPIMRNRRPERRHNAGKFEKDSLESDWPSDQEDFPSKCKFARREDFVDLQDDEQENSPPKFKSRLREELAEIDKAFEDDVFESTCTSAKPKDLLSFGKAVLLHEANSGAIQPESMCILAFTTPPSVSEDVFDGPPLTLSPVDVPQSSFSLSSPPAHRHRARRSNPRFVLGSDSEEEVQKGSSSTAPSTSGHNSFVSAKSRFSSTPPTSDEDVPSKISVNSELSHSRKPESTRVSVPPLGFAESSSNEGKRSRKSRQTKIKPPTKKELRETVKERSRLAAQRKVSVARAEAPMKYTLQRLLEKVGPQSGSQLSDPIEPFSSPTIASPPTELAHSKPVSPSLPRQAESLQLLDDPDDSEDELPEITELLREDAKKRHAEELKQMKQWALEQQTATELQDSEDDELVISTDPKTTIKEEEENRRSKHSKQSMARKKVAQLAHVNPAKRVSVISPSRVRKDFHSVIQEIAASGSSDHLHRVLFAQAQAQASREIRRKEEAWTKHGGHLAQQPVAPAESFECAVKAIASRGLEIVKATNSNRIETDSDNDEDEEWRPKTRESASPAAEEHQDDDSEMREIMLVDGDITLVAEEQNADDSDSDNARVHKSRRNFVLSDSEEEGLDKHGLGDPIFRSPASSGLATEDEHDKENNTKLMYDQGEDKENKRVVRHALTPKRYDIFHITDAALSSPELSPQNFRLGDVNSTTRRPFQELLSEERPFTASSSTQTFASKLQQASPLPSTFAPAATLKPFLEDGSAFAGFSQFSMADLGEFGAAPLQPGFSELFESGTEKRKLPLDLAMNRSNESISDENHDSTKLRHIDALDLTQDVAAAIQLQPAFQAEESLLRKADAIFEKEQAFVIEANTRKVARQHTELYVNELGFLTQTRPLDGTPEVYRRVSPLSSAVRSGTERSIQRMPLQTLSLSSPSQFESPRQRPLRRLRKVIDTPPRTRVRSPTVSPPARPNRRLDAHEELRRGQQVQRRNEEIRRKRSELGILFEDEAAESDDDDMFGFVTKKLADDEEDGDDLDQNLVSLVDDQKMDEDTEAVDLVLDKYKEHLEEDDKKLEELHQAAVQGQLRQKRNRGVGIDDSDDESDMDDNERARRAMKRARKSERTDIKGLEANEDTRAFADSYNQCLRDDDDDDFAFLEKRGDIAEVVGGHTESRDEDDDGENVDPFEVRKAIQERAREGRLDEDGINPDDVSWLDQDEEMEDVPRVKSVNTRQGKSRPQISDLDTVISSSKSPARVNQASKQWFNEESKTRKASTARKNGGLAVTGHRKRESRGHSSASGPSSAPVRQVKAAASALSIFADRRGKFG